MGIEAGKSSVVRVNPARLFRTLIALASLLLAAHLGVRLLAELLGRNRMATFTRLFHLDLEANIPTWYASTTLLLAAAILGIIALREQQQVTAYRRHWTLLSVIFVYLSLDETAQIHEPASAWIRETFHTGGPLYQAWVIPAMVLLAVLAIYYLNWLRSLPPVIRALALASAVLYVGGALGMELLSGWIARPGSRFYSYVATLEETLEMLGVALWIYTLARYASGGKYDLVLRFEQKGPGRRDQ